MHCNQNVSSLVTRRLHVPLCASPCMTHCVRYSYLSMFLCFYISFSISVSLSLSLCSAFLLCHSLFYLSCSLFLSLSLSLSLSDTCNGETDVCVLCGNCSQCNREIAKKWPSACCTANACPLSQALMLMAAMRQRIFTAKLTLKQSDNNYAASAASARMLENTTWKANLRKHLKYEWDAQGTLLALDVSVSVNIAFWISLSLSLVRVLGDVLVLVSPGHQLERRYVTSCVFRKPTIPK